MPFGHRCLIGPYLQVIIYLSFIIIIMLMYEYYIQVFGNDWFKCGAEGQCISEAAFAHAGRNRFNQNRYGMMFSSLLFFHFFRWWLLLLLCYDYWYYALYVYVYNLWPCTCLHKSRKKLLLLYGMTIRVYIFCYYDRIVHLSIHLSLLTGAWKMAKPCWLSLIIGIVGRKRKENYYHLTKRQVFHSFNVQ